MPPVNPQGSRGGLVAAVIVFTVLFVAATIFAIYYGVQDSKAEEQLTGLTSRYKSIALDLTGPDVQQLTQQAKSNPNLTEQTALAEAVRERNELRKMIVGQLPAPGAASAPPLDTTTQNDIADARAQAKKAMDAASAVLGPAAVKFSADESLVQTVADLTTAITHLNKATVAANTDRDYARQQAQRDSQAAQNAQAIAERTVNTAKEQVQQQLDAASDSVKKAEDQVASAKKTFEDEQRASSVALESSDKDHAQLVSELDSSKRDNTLLRNKLAGKRIGVEDPMVRRPEGEVVRITDANTVYINLGQGDQIIPGMTFEVYDKSLPLPKLGDGLSDDGLPVGKASLEVTRVLPNGSECHVTHVEGGQQIVQGDPILNLIYDPNVKFNFYVFGDFDIATTGHATPAGADVVKRLVTQWGGAVDPNLDVQTDFVVIGAPPEIPPYSQDELKDPINAQKLSNFKRAANDYDKVVEKAKELHIPILNQSRFLYFTGYHDLASR